MNEIVQIWNVYHVNWWYFERGSDRNKGKFCEEKITNISDFKQSVNWKKILDFVKYMKDSGDEILRENKPIK